MKKIVLLFVFAILAVSGIASVPTSAEAAGLQCSNTPMTNARTTSGWDYEIELNKRAASPIVCEGSTCDRQYKVEEQPEFPFTVLGRGFTDESQPVNPAGEYYSSGQRVTYTSTADCSTFCEAYPGAAYCGSYFGGALTPQFSGCTAYGLKSGVSASSIRLVPASVAEYDIGAYGEGGGVSPNPQTKAGSGGFGTCVQEEAATADLVGLVGSPAGGTANQAVTLYGGAQNQGQGTSASFPNIFQVCDANCATINQAVEATRLPGLASQVAQNISGVFTPAAPGQLFYRTCANMNTSWLNEASESNYGNNCSNWQYLLISAEGAADLTPGVTTAPTVTATFGQSVTISGTAYNAGNASTGSGFRNIIMTNLNGSGLSWDTVREAAPNAATLNAGATASFSTTFPASTFAAPGTYSYGYCVDFNTSWVGSIAESNEGNNCISGTIVINPADVTPTGTLSCTVDRQSVQANETVSYTAGGAGTAPYAWTAADGASGFGSGATASRTFSANGTYSMQVSATGAGNVAQCPLVTVGNLCTGGANDLTITAAPNRVRTNTVVTVSWNVVGANSQSCSVTGPGINWTSAVSAAPSCSVSGSATPTINAQSTYTLTCGSTSKSVVVNVVPNFIEF